MSELFDDEEDKATVTENEVVDLDIDIDVEADEESSVLDPLRPVFDARRRLENLLEEKRLRDELEDFFDYSEENS